MSTDVEILSEITRSLKNGKRVALCTMIEKTGSGPRAIGAKIMVTETGQTVGTIGGGTLERALVIEAMKALRTNMPCKKVFSLNKDKKKEAINTGLICGGELTIFIDVIEPKKKLVMIGAGHIAWSLARMADVAGYSITVVDDNETLANQERFPMAEQIFTGDFAETLRKIDVGSRDFVVILHGEPEHDYMALAEIIRKKPGYLGLLGSKVKVAAFIQKLREEGVDDESLKVLHAPIGVDIGAQTPGEIGVSILAEIIRARGIVDCQNSDKHTKK